jgi:hypothetical protein
VATEEQLNIESIQIIENYSLLCDILILDYSEWDVSEKAWGRDAESAQLSGKKS